MSNAPATTQGRAAALAALKERREKAQKEIRIDNASLYAGSPMYYYCIACGLIADVLPECHQSTPRKLCKECQAIKDMDWPLD